MFLTYFEQIKNNFKKMYTEITSEEFKKKFLQDKNRFELIDVREKFEFDYMKIE